MKATPRSGPTACRRRLAPAAAAVLGMALVAGCTHSTSATGTSPDPVGATAGAPAPVATAAQAAAVTARYDRLRIEADAGLTGAVLRRIETGAALRMNLARFHVLSTLHGRHSPPAAVQRRRYYLPPSQPGRTPWFAAVGQEAGAAGQGGQVRYELFLNEGADWRLARSVRGEAGDQPTVATVGGIARVLGPAEVAGLPAPPAEVAAAIAARITHHPARPGVRIAGSGALSAMTIPVPGAGSGIGASAVAMLTRDPVYVLRTAEGGTVMFLVIGENRTVTAIAAGQKLQVAGTAAAAFLGTKGRARVTEQRHYSLAVHVDAAGQTVTVVAYDRVLVNAR